MAITIVATVGSASANSFVTEVEQIAYMAPRLNPGDWSTVTGSTLSETEKAGLVEATRDISVLGWKTPSKRVDGTQILSWPRQFAFDPDSPISDYYATTVIPQRVKNATMELAFQFVKAGTTDLAALPSDIEKQRTKLDVIETEFVESHNRAKGLRRFPRVWNEISPLLEGAGITVPLVRG